MVYRKFDLNACFLFLQMLYVMRVARLAQLAEQLTLNQLVRGSSPRPGTIAFAISSISKCCCIACRWLRRFLIKHIFKSLFCKRSKILTN